MLRLGSTLELRNDECEIDLLSRTVCHVLGDTQQRGERFPTFSNRSCSGRRIGCPTERAEHGLDLFYPADASCGATFSSAYFGAQGKQCLAHLGPLVEPFPSAHQVGDAALREDLLDNR